MVKESMGRCTVEELLEVLGTGAALYDVRTPAEFEHAHIPGARNLPLFSNDERAVVGTAYKKVGRHHAIKVGLDLIGPRMRELVEVVEAQVGPPGPDAEVFVHCWRGGMRSQSVGWLLGLYGYQVTTLAGGYKSFRHWVLERLQTPPPLTVLGGRTGSGKTQVLDALAERGEAVLDLEGLANHRGSAFGALELPAQPSQEQFEALLALEFERLGDGRAWVEDEARMIGSCKVPNPLMDAMRAAQVIVMDVPMEERVRILVDIYGDAPIRGLEASFHRIRKRLGNERMVQALTALDDRDLATAAEIALSYYDKAYDHGLSKREPTTLHRVEVQALESGPDAVLRAAERLSTERSDD